MGLAIAIYIPSYRQRSICAAPYWTVIMFSFLAFVLDPASPIAGHRMMAREHYRQASGWYSVDGFSGSRVDLFSIRLVKNLWRIQLCQFPYKDIQKCPLSNDPKFYLLYRCRSRMSERSCWLQPKFHLLFLTDMCIIIPRLWSWRKASHGLFQV